MKYYIMLAIAYILNIVDYAFTSHWVKLFGLEVEANPIGRWLFENNLAWIAKILIVGAFFGLLGILMPRYKLIRAIAVILCLVFGAICAYHCVIAVRLAFINKS